jgi:hypothetical protein
METLYYLRQINKTQENLKGSNIKYIDKQIAQLLKN